MKKVILCLLLTILSLGFLFSDSDLMKEKLRKYSGKNFSELWELYNSKESEVREYAQFILDYATPNDLAILTKDYLEENINFALKSRELSYAKDYSESVFKHFVLPHRVSQEPLEPWRKQFFEEIKPLVKNAKTVEEAAIIVNLWVAEQMYFKRTSARDQAPLTTIKRGYGRCEESMIIYIAAARAVGIPVRPASVPFWNIMDNNHAWVEVWTPNGWEYVGEAENSLSRTWFTKPTKRAGLITSRAFGDYDSKDLLKYKNGSATINSTRYYNFPVECNFKVTYKGEMVPKAKLTFYAASYGGMFRILDLETEENGEKKLSLGESSFFVTAAKDSLFGYMKIDTIQNRNFIIALKDSVNFDDEFVMSFKLPSDSKNKEKKEILGKDFYLKRDIANLKRKERMNQWKDGESFLEFYDEIYFEEDEEYFEKRMNFFKKADELAGNSENFKKVFVKNDSDNLKKKIGLEMIQSWNIKDLIEIPDSSSIANIINIFADVKENFELPDSLFYKNTLAIPEQLTNPQNGWQKEFVKKISALESENIPQTVDNINDFIEKQTNVDSTYMFSYFSPSLNPLDLINLKNMPSYYRMKLAANMMRYLGIPIRWKGQLEYYNGESFIAWKENNKKDTPIEKKNIIISVYKDGEKIKAEPWSNFILGKISESGILSYTFFDGEYNDLSFEAEYIDDGRPTLVQGYLRNENGDAFVRLISIENAENNEVNLNLEIPQIQKDDKSWKEETLKNLTNIIPENSQPTILFIRGKKANEPEVRMWKQIKAKMDRFNKTNFVVYSVLRDDFESEGFNDVIVRSGENLITEEVDWNDYPVIFIFDKTGSLVNSYIGYQMGIADLIKENLK